MAERAYMKRFVALHNPGVASKWFVRDMAKASIVWTSPLHGRNSVKYSYAAEQIALVLNRELPLEPANG